MDPRAVAAGKRQPPVGPGQPRRGDGDLRHPAQVVGVFLRLGQGSQGGRVPRSADHRNANVTFLLRFADDLAHGGFAAQVAFLGRLGFTQDGDQVGDGTEDFQARVLFLELFLPPAFAVRVTGDRRDRRQGIAPQPPGFQVRRRHVHRRLVLAVFGRLRLFKGLPRRFLQGHAVPQGQVHETHWHPVRQCPADRLPLRRKLGERVKGGALRFVGLVDEQRDGRAHLRVRGEGKKPIHVRRTFHQHGLRADRFQSVHDAACRTWPVVADAQDVRAFDHGVANPLPGRRGRGLSSRRAP